VPYVSELFQFAYYGQSFWGMIGLNLIDHSYIRPWPPTILTSVWVCVCVKGNFLDEQGNRRDLVEIFCVCAVGGLS